jgi:hypothetical protein
MSKTRSGVLPTCRAQLRPGKPRRNQAFRDMTEAYFAAFRDGDADAIATVIDFYGGAGTFASWPAKVRA